MMAVCVKPVVDMESAVASSGASAATESVFRKTPMAAEWRLCVDTGNRVSPPPL